MEITYLGHSSFKLRGRQATLVTDPFNPEMVGLKFPKVEADIVTVSHQHKDHSCTSLVSGTPIIVAGPGEYEIKGVKIMGVSSYHDEVNGRERGANTVYRMEIDKISLVHCGDLGHKFDEKSLDILDGVDVLMIPVGGIVNLSPQLAAEVASQLEPKIIIPMHYNRPDLNQKIFSDIAPVEVFLKIMGKEGIKPVPKLHITKDKLPEEQMVVVFDL